MDEVHFYYIECRIQEVYQLRDNALASRVSESDKKGWSKFTKSLEKNASELRLQIEDEVIEGSSTAAVVRGNKNVDSFFGQLMNMPKLQTVPRTKESGEKR